MFISFEKLVTVKKGQRLKIFNIPKSRVLKLKLNEDFEIVKTTEYRLYVKVDLSKPLKKIRIDLNNPT